VIASWRLIPSPGQYSDALFEFLSTVETRNNSTPDYAAYLDSRGNVTNGIGFNLADVHVRSVVYAVLQQNDSLLANRPDLQAKETGYFTAMTAAIASKNALAFNAAMAARANDPDLRAVLGSLPSVLNDTIAGAILTTLVETYERQVDSWLPGIPQSSERIVLVSLAYNSQVNPRTGIATLLGSGLKAAIESGDRAEAWYQIRYNSDPASTDAKGIAKRRFYESQEFGLFADPTAPTAAEALQAYQTLTAHRGAILPYEATYGTNPFATSPLTASKQIAAANSDYGLAGTQTQVQTLAALYDLAAQMQIRSLNAQYGSELPQIVTDDSGGSGASSFNVRSIDIYATSATISTADVLGYPDGTQNHILVGTEAGDRLVGGLGDDILIAQGGDQILQSGAGADTLIASAGNDTVLLRGSSDVLEFNLPGPVSFKETIIDDGTLGAGSISVAGTQLGVGLTATGTDEWSDASGNTYRFAVDPISPPQGYSAAVVGSDVGELEILVGDGGNEIDVWGFNLSSAEHAQDGFLGIKMPQGVSITGGSNAGLDPPTADFIGGTSQTYTVWVNTGSSDAQTVTMALSGVPVSDFGLATPTGIQSLSSGTFTVVMPAGETSVSFTLVNTADAGAGTSLQLSAGLSDPNDPANPAVSDPLTQNYVEPTPNPFNTNTTNVIAGQAEFFRSTPYTEYVGDGSDDLIAANSGVNSIVGGNGNTLITGGGGQGVIVVGSGDNHIYAGSQVDLQTAIDAESSAGTATGQGYFIGAGDGDNTIVGGAGNDLIMVGDGNNFIVAGANDTVWGGEAADGASLNWSASIVGGISVAVDNFGIYTNNDSGTAEGGIPPAGYEGFVDYASGRALAVGTGNDTIFGGSGNGVFALSNGNNYVSTGLGSDLVFGGMGSSTIIGGTGNISVLGGGGSEYMEAGSGDSLLVGRGGNNTLIGGSGSDTLIAGNIADPGTDDWRTSETGNNYVQGGSGDDFILGAGGQDTLIAGSGNSTIYAGAGSELVIGGSGNDWLQGGTGDSTIEAGGAGNDSLLGIGSSASTTVIFGGDGSDTIQGGSGTNILYAGDGGSAERPTDVLADPNDATSNTTIYGGYGVDLLTGGPGSCVIYAGDGGTSTSPTQIVAGSGDTTAYGGLGVDAIFGGSGTDVLYAGDGGTNDAPTTVAAGSGNATLYGGAGADLLQDLTNGDDLLVAGTGNDTVFSTGNDTVVAGTGSDYFVGSGSETYVLNSDVGNTYISAQGSASRLEFGSDVQTADLSVTADLTDAGTAVLEIGMEGGSVSVDGGLTGSISTVTLADSGSMSLAELISQDGVDQTVSGANGNLIFQIESGVAITGGVGFDTISAWGDNDTLSGGVQAGVIAAGGTANEIFGGAQTDTIVASGGDDTITAGAGSDLITSSGQSALITGGLGNDSIIATGDHDTITAGLSGDQITASGNFEQILGGSGFDTITASGDGDTITAGTGGDLIVVSGDYASIVGGWGDILTAAGHADTIGGGEYETFVVQDATTVIQPVDGWRDTILSSVSYVLNASVSTLTLTGSEDLTATDAYGYATVTGNAGNDTLMGGAGSDELVAGSGVDTLVGGSGFTTFVINNEADVIQVNHASAGSVQSSVSYTLGQDLDALVLTGTDNLVGTGNDDSHISITGNSGNDTLIAGAGDDTLFAGSGVDTLVAGAGTDLLEGVNGDTFVFNAGFGDAEVSLSGGSGTLQFGVGLSPSQLSVGLTVGWGDTSLVIQDGEGGSVTVDGGLTGSISGVDFAAGADYTLAQFLAAANVLSETAPGASGDAILSGTTAASVAGGVGDDTIFAVGASDTLVAGSGNQVLYGLGPGDVLAGSIGDDTLHGGAGSDTLIGGTGNTVMDGGQGSDFYMLTAGGTATVIPGSAAGTEVIYLPTGMTFSDFTAFEGLDGDLILRSVSGDTTAVIQGFHNTTSTKTWLLADDTDAPVFLTDWLGSKHPNGSDSTYTRQIDGLRQAYEAKLGTTLNAIGLRGGSITDPTSSQVSSLYFDYQFSGVTINDVTVQGGSLTLGPSQEVQSTTTVATSNTTRKIVTPVYGTVTVPGKVGAFLPVSTDTVTGGVANQYGNPSGGFFVPVYDSAGNLTGYNVALPATTRTVQTGTVTTVETVPVETYTTDETQSFTVYNVTGDGNDAITASSPFAGTVVTGDGNVSVDLGEQAQYDSGWGGSPADYAAYPHVDVFTGYGDPPGSQSPGAFIEVGNGNDTIWGTENGTIESVTGGSWSSDIIAAGTGFDYLNGSVGTTYYTPLEGYSTDVIGDPAAAYGAYVPLSTLVLPQGVHPQDLQYRVYQDPDSQAQMLQLRDGNAAVLVAAQGVDSFQFAGGTVLTRDQLIAQATLLPNDFNPVVAAQTAAWPSGGTISAAELFSVTDTPDNPVTWFRLANTGGGSFELDGQAQAAGRPFMVNAGQLSQLSYIAGPDGSNDLIQVSAFDGAVWSSPTTLTVSPESGVAAADALPFVLGTSESQTLSGGTGGAFIATYAGDDVISTGVGHNVVAFNSGGGEDTIAASPGAANVLSLGGGIDVETLSFSVSGNDLVLSTPVGDSLTFQNWYADPGNRDFATVQVVDQPDWDPASSDPLRTNETEEFDFGQLVAQFDAARAADPTMSSWQVADGLESAHLGGSDTQVFGGDLAYYYGSNYNGDGLAGMNLTAVQDILQDPQYAISLQTVHPWEAISGGAVHV
jgi:Ca2+-binding RTX toxin-like protein